MMNWFNTLNEALESESLLHTWDCTHSPMEYGSSVTYTFQDGTRYGHLITLYRDERGMYERPVHYGRQIMLLNVIATLVILGLILIVLEDF